MTLNERFQQWFINDKDEHYEGMVEQVAIEHEKIADEFAIEFAEWKDKNCIYYDGWNIRIPLGDKYNDVYTNEELLKIFKKEKGL